MKIDPRQLPVLMDFNQQVFQIRKLEAEASRIAAGGGIGEHSCSTSCLERPGKPDAE